MKTKKEIRVISETEQMILKALKRKLESFKNRKAEFDKRAKENFNNALEWAEQAAVTNAEAVIALKTINYFSEVKKEQSLLSVIQEVLDMLSKEQKAFYGNQSTSLFSNAVQQAEARARVNMIGYFESFCRELRED